MTVLSAGGIVKRYGGVAALRGVDIELAAGEIHALVGENGAGKSTLVKVLCGVTRPDSGTVRVDDQPVTFSGTQDAAARGLAIVAQELSLFPDLMVCENLGAADPPRRFGIVRRRVIDERAAPVLAGIGLDVDLRARVGDLSLADQQLLEICRALMQQPRVLILDEPTSALSRPASARLERVLRRLAGEGLAILYISHYLEEVMRLAGRVTVLRDGRTVLGGVPAGEVALDRLVTAMVGGAVPVAQPRVVGETASGARPDRLSLRDVHVPGALAGVSLQVAAGEIVGLAGLPAAGQLTVLEAVCGRVRPAAGEVRLPGGVRPRSLRHAYAHGVGFVPSDRKRYGLMLDKTVWENVTSVGWLGLGRGGRLQRTGELRRRAGSLAYRLRVRGDADTVVGTLSGGNQQKVVFAKWLDVDPAVMVLDDPTRGVDVGARAEMHGIVRQLADRGKILLVASTDLAELVELCDRVVVFQRGRVVDELAGQRLDERTLSAAMNAGFAGAS